MIAKRHDVPKRTVDAVLWRLLQITLLLPLIIWNAQREAGRSATKGAL